MKYKTQNKTYLLQKVYYHQFTPGLLSFSIVIHGFSCYNVGIDKKGRIYYATNPKTGNATYNVE